MNKYDKCDCAAKGSIRCDMCERCYFLRYKWHDISKEGNPPSLGEYECIIHARAKNKSGITVYDIRHIKYSVDAGWDYTNVDEIVAWRKIKE